MSARPPLSAAALFAALCLLLTAVLVPAPAGARVRHHHHRHPRTKTTHHHRRHLVTHTHEARGRVTVDAAAKKPDAPTPRPGAQPRFGAFTTDAPYAGNVDAVGRLQTALRRPIDIVNWYQSFGGGEWVSRVQPDVIRAVTDSGRTPLLTWEPWDPTAGADQPQYRLRRIAEGDFDAYIASWADALRDAGQEVDLRPMHEMNGNWYPWSAGVGDNTPELYVAAWRRMHDIFVDRGATNVRWVWSPVTYSVPNTPANALERYYPGAGYVDVLALDGYNWGSAKPEYGGWQSFGQVFEAAYHRIEALGPQPIWIAEVGSAPGGGDKARWVRDMWTTAASWPRLKAIVGFDQDKEEDWRALPVASAFAAPAR
ncbi:MAG: glycoside hydrolase family 26 protein [Solirubrobacteraceae bacterium]